MQRSEPAIAPEKTAIPSGAAPSSVLEPCAATTASCWKKVAAAALLDTLSKLAVREKRPARAMPTSACSTVAAAAPSVKRQNKERSAERQSVQRHPLNAPVSPYDRQSAA